VDRPVLKKALGQHHLVDGALCRPLVAFLRPAGGRVLEIGPGGGILTAELLAAGARVWGAELDPEWALVLHRRFRGAPLSLAVADALAIRWDRLPAPTAVAGNLPYNVATALIERLLPHGGRIPRAAFLVQREVALRLVAAPGEEHYGSFSVLVAAYARAAVLGRVRPGAFRPPPKVESAFVGFELHAPPLPPADMGEFIRFVRLAFGQRRKTLRNALSAGWGRERTAAVLDPGKDAGRRAGAGRFPGDLAGRRERGMIPPGGSGTGRRRSPLGARA
jgi:16S rRNA (adenine1518-N6/adenine1519-N6)-dimethyltransferase